MTDLAIFFAIITFVIPAICILSDNKEWARKNKS